MSVPTVVRYIDLLVDLLLVRRLPPLAANTGKRLVKSPKVYVRDSGIVHALLGIEDREGLAGHPVVGPSWDAFYRTAAGAEIDLVLDLPKAGRWVVEIKRGLDPAARFVVYAGTDRYPMGEGIEAIGLRAMAQTLAEAS